MKLSEILELNYAKRKPNARAITTLGEIYGIIYRIYCIPEDKSYVGQTYSHHYAYDPKQKKRYLSRHGIIGRCKKHYQDRDLEIFENRPLYKALNTHNPDQFEVIEEKRLFGKELASINTMEGETMEKYNCIHPNGYNIEKVGKKYSMILKNLALHYGFDIVAYKYEDNSRNERCKELTLGTYFDIERQQLGPESTLDLLQSIEVEGVRLVESNGLRIIVSVKGEKDKIRVYFQGTTEECLEFARKISDNISLSESFRGDECYRYQCKLDKVSSDLQIINIAKGQRYYNRSTNIYTYLLSFHGKRKIRQSTLHRISFGGKTQTIKQSYNLALEFIDKLKAQGNTDHIKFNLIEPNIEV